LRLGRFGAVGNRRWLRRGGVGGRRFQGCFLDYLLTLAQEAAPLHAPLGAARDLQKLQRLALAHGLAVK
jgi:hypothetical protein